MTAAPPWTPFGWPVATVTLPRPPAIEVTVPRTPAAITVAWPRGQVTQDRPPPPPRVIRLAAPPQGPWRLPFPNGHPLRNPGLLPPRRR